MDDLLIVGGGPSGLAAAIYAAREGLSVRVLEAQSDIIDKACGEGLMPGGVATLKELDVDIAHKRPFKGIRYVEKHRSADGLFHQGDGWGIRRTVLHQALRARVLALGVPIEQHRVKTLEQKDDSVCVDKFCGRYLIGADGLNSSIRRLAGVRFSKPQPHRYGVRRHFAIKPWSDFVEVHWTPLAEAYVTPVDDKLVGVALLFSDELRDKLKGEGGQFYLRALEQFPALRERCQAPVSSSRGAGPFKTLAQQRVKGRVLLVGDAAGYLDPITGEGLRLGFASAKVAVSAIVNNSPEVYDRQWYRMTRRYWWATSGLLALRRREWLRRMMLPALSTVPGMFDQILREIESS